MMPDIAIPPIDLATCANINFGGAVVRPSLREIEVGGVVETLEPRVMQVLVLLAEMEGQTVSRDLMVERCWGGVIVGDDAIQRCIGRLRKLAHATGAFEITTVSRVGYRLLVGGSTQDGKPNELRVKQSIAVVDFRILDDRGNDGAFAECLADDICAALAVNRDVRVVARATASIIADGARDPVSIGAALNVRYVVSGTVRPSVAGRRITVQLFDTETAQILWSHQQDLAGLENYPSDDIVIDVAGRLVVKMMHDEIERVMRKSSDITSWEAVIRSVSTYRRIALDALPFAVSEARRAIELAPEYGAAHAALANALAATFEVSGGADMAIAAETEAHCDQAMALNPADPTVLASVGNALGMIGSLQPSLPLLERAVELAPTHTSAHLYLARAYLRDRRPDDALQALASHNRIAPQCHWHYFVLYNESLAHFMAGRTELAEETLDRSIIYNPNYPYAWLSKAILMMLLDRPVEAHRAADRLRRLEGKESLPLQLSRIANGYPDPHTRTILQSMLTAAWNGEKGGK